MTLDEILLPYQKQFAKKQKRFKLWVASRQIGKSFCIAYISAYKALKKDNNLVLLISLGARTANELLKKCVQFAEAVKVLSDNTITYTASADNIKFSNGSRILSLPSGNINALRSWTSVCTIIDEAAFVERLDEVLQAIGPSLTRNPESELIFTTTPAGKNGYFYDLYQKAKDDDSWYVQETTIHDAIAQGLKVDIGQLHILCPDPDVFRQEYECYFSNEYGSMVDINLLDYYDSEIITDYDGVYFAADIGRAHDKTAITIIKTKNDNYYLDEVIILNKCEYQRQLDIFKNLNDKYFFTGGYIDAGGIGSAVAEFANKNVSAKIKPFQFTSSNKTSLYEALRDKIFQRKIHFNIKFKDIIETDVRNVQRTVNEQGIVKFIAGRNSEGHSDFVSSCVLCLHAAHENPINAQAPITFGFNSIFGSCQSRLS